MSGVYIKGLNIEPRDDGFDGKGLVIVGYDDKLYAVAHEQIIPLPDHGRLVDADALKVHHGINVGANYGGLRAVVFKKDIDNAPTIELKPSHDWNGWENGCGRTYDFEPKTGKWYDWSFTAFDGCTVWHRVCSACGYKRDDDNLDKDTNYCPNCGARMDG